MSTRPTRHNAPYACYRSYSIYSCLLAHPSFEQISFLVPGHCNSSCLRDSWTKIDFNDVDLAFVFGKSLPINPGTRATLFMPGTSIPVCSPSLFEKLDRKDQISAILEAGLLHDCDVDGWTRWFVKIGQASVPKSSGMVFEDFNLMRTAALSGQGVALCPLAIIRSDLMSNQLVPLSPVSINEDCNYYLVQRETNKTETMKTANAFKSWLFEMRDSESDSTEFHEAAVCQE